MHNCWCGGPSLPSQDESMFRRCGLLPLLQSSFPTSGVFVFSSMVSWRSPCSRPSSSKQILCGSPMSCSPSNNSSANPTTKNTDVCWMPVWLSASAQPLPCGILKHPKNIFPLCHVIVLPFAGHVRGTFATRHQVVWPPFLLAAT